MGDSAGKIVTKVYAPVFRRFVVHARFQHWRGGQDQLTDFMIFLDKWSLLQLPSLSLKHQYWHPECMSQCAVLCANKTLFTKLDLELD